MNRLFQINFADLALLIKSAATSEPIDSFRGGVVVVWKGCKAGQHLEQLAWSRNTA